MLKEDKRVKSSLSPKSKVKRAPGRVNSPAACTIIFRNYLSYATILAKSFITHVPHGRFYLLVVDGLPPGVRVDPRIQVLSAEDLQLPYFYEMCFNYNVTELSTAVKP